MLLRGIMRVTEMLLVVRNIPSTVSGQRVSWLYQHTVSTVLCTIVVIIIIIIIIMFMKV